MTTQMPGENKLRFRMGLPLQLQLLGNVQGDVIPGYQKIRHDNDSFRPRRYDLLDGGTDIRLTELHKSHPVKTLWILLPDDSHQGPDFIVGFFSPAAVG
jgi:hypothetical protein